MPDAIDVHSSDRGAPGSLSLREDFATPRTQVAVDLPTDR
jgi:hypothetical protein